MFVPTFPIAARFLPNAARFQPEQKYGEANEDFLCEQTMRQQPLTPGDMAFVLLPHSEVCMHMRVADQYRWIRLLPGEYPMVQIYNADFSRFSAPITTGEAGVYTDRLYGYYTYVPFLGQKNVVPVRKDY